ncbi:MAG TPA: YbdK family carboxylate-amine ligase [Solirubrobacteraceae bacterium]|jgi:carboxylate-amine ligase
MEVHPAVPGARGANPLPAGGPAEPKQRFSRRDRPERGTRVHARSPHPVWARWNGAKSDRYTIGVEEEMLLLDASDLSLAQASEAVLGRLSGELLGHTSPETHAAVLELKTDVHDDASAAVAQIAELRAEISSELGTDGLRAAGTGTYPLKSIQEIQLSQSSHYRDVGNSMRSLARRPPTLALHIHVGVPDPEDAVALLNGMRQRVPLLLALSANSPFSAGRDGGFASERTVIFQTFPRTGIPRAFSGYDEYVRTVDVMIASGAIPDPSFVWWDVRLQPALGTLEVRVMDAQMEVADSAALVALVQSLARLELEDGPGIDFAPELLAENRFLAARDGMDAQLIDPERRQLIPVWEMLEAVLACCRPHAAALGCAAELEQVARLAVATGTDRQRACAEETGSLNDMLTWLTERFCAREAIETPRLGGTVVGGRVGHPGWSPMPFSRTHNTMGDTHVSLACI